MLMEDSFASRMVRKLGLEHALVLNTADFKMMQALFAPAYTADHPQRALIHKLGLVGFFTMSYVSAMEAAIQHHACFAASLRYEDLLVAKERLVKAVLGKCGFASKFRAVPAEQLTKVFSSDAHGESSTTASKRFKRGGGRQFIAPHEDAGVLAILAAHPKIAVNECIVPGTITADQL